MFMKNSGIVLSVNISNKKGEKKIPIDTGVITDNGLEGDAHAGNWHRQISLLAEESIDKMKGKGLDIHFGDFAENITTRGVDLLTLPLGQRIGIGENVVLEVTQIGKICHSGCEIQKIVGDCVMPKEGIFTKVISGGEIKAGDIVKLL